MHKYPIFYFSIHKNEIEPEQIDRLLYFEKEMGDVKLSTGVGDLKFDFNAGVRVEVPAGDWYVKISDFDTGMVAFDGDVSEQILISLEKYYIHWYIEVWFEGKKVFEHLMDLYNKIIHIFMVDGVLGDTISVLPYVNTLREKYNANVTLSVPEAFSDLCKEYIPEIKLQKNVSDDSYAGYCLAVFDLPPYLIPDDSRHWPPFKSAQVILGLHKKAPDIRYYPTAPREIQEKYVCIAVQASGIMKRWLYPDGWEIVVEYLKSLGYRVLCIDASDRVEEYGYEIVKPEGAEDFTGMKPLMERINLLAYADFFVGLGSGLSWLADACGIPVVLISGFSLPIAEFDTPYRIYNQFVCHGCYNDLKTNWKKICPYHRGTDREYECSKSITPLQVVQAIDRLLEDKKEQKNEVCMNRKISKKEIFFLPYKASMWDSMESVWKAAAADNEHCNTYVVPIPYYDINSDGSIGELHCEADIFPDYVPVMDWHDFQLERLKALHPDAIFIHNPYDDVNVVTSVDKQYYSRELKNVTDYLCYIPYYATAGGMSENQAMLPAYKNADAIFVQAERLRDFFDESVRHKIVPLGSPKFDKIIGLEKNPCKLPKGWADKIKDRKVYFFNTSLSGMLADPSAFLQKMAYVFNNFVGRKDVCLLWRPHPLMLPTLKSVREDAVYGYEKLRTDFIKSGIGIYDDTPQIETAISCSDVYIGDLGTSVTSLFGVAGKPIFALDNQIHELPGPDDWIGKAFNRVVDDTGDWLITWNNCLLHSPNHNHSYEFYCRLNEDQDGSYYNRVIVKDDKIYVCPCSIQNILVIKDRKIINTIPLKNEDSREYLFTGAHLVGDKIFLIPLRYPAVVCIDIRDDTVSYIEGLKEFISMKQDDDWLVGGSCVFKDKLYISAINSAKQIIITAEPSDVEIRDISPNCSIGFNMLVPDEDYIWMYGAREQEIWKWNPIDDTLEKYSGFPEGFTCYHPGAHYECDLLPLGFSAYNKDYLYIVPRWGNQFLKLNKATGEIVKWDTNFSPSPKTANGYLYTWAIGCFIWGGLKCDSRDLKFVYWPTRKLYHVNLDDDIWEEIPISFDDESKYQMQIGYDRMSTWFLYGCMENAFNSLKDLLNDTIHGKQFDREQQLAAYSSIAANIDGTAGGKIYKFVMERARVK